MKIAGIVSTNVRNCTNFGRKINGKEYPENIVRQAEAFLSNNRELNRKDYEKDFMDCMAEVKFQPLSWAIAGIIAFLDRQDFDEDLIDTARLCLAITTFGLSEIPKTIEGGIRKGISNYQAKKHVKQIKDCMISLIKERNLKI